MNPYAFQHAAVEWLLERSGGCVWAEQGTGKTVVTSEFLRRLSTREHFAALVVVPLANIDTTWVTTLAKFGVSPHRSWDAFKRAGYTGTLLLHYEALKKALVSKLVKRRWTAVVYDESQRLKERGTKQSRAAARFKTVDHRVCLSGTPIEQAPQDLWAQMRFACPGVLERSWSTDDGDGFADRWCKPSGFMGLKWKFREALIPKFLALVEPHFLRIRKADVLDLPELKFVRHSVEMQPGQARLYRDLSDESYAELGDREIFCDLEITKLVRLQQVTGGFIRVDRAGNEKKGPIVRVGSSKIQRLRGIVASSSRPIVVFCKYRWELEAIVACVSTIAGIDRIGVVRGARKGAQRRERSQTVERFQRGELDVIACQVKAGGVGIDLFRSCEVVFYSCTWSYIDFYQAVSRVHRHGQTRDVTIHLLQATNTVDTDIWEALVMKKTVTKRILDRRKSTMAKPEAKKTPEVTKKAETAKPETEAKKTAPPQPPKPKYGVPELAELLGIKPSGVRVKLRNKAIPKSGKLYGWDTAAEMKEVAAKLKEAKAKKSDEDDSDDEE